MKIFRTIITAILVLCVWSISVASASVLDTQLDLQVNTIHSQQPYVPGKDYPIAFNIKIPKGLLLHGHETSPDQMLVPTNLTLTSREGIAIEGLRFPAPEEVKLAYSTDKIEVYRGEVLIRGRLHIGKKVRPGFYKIEGTLSYQACTFDSCFPPEKQQIVVTVEVAPPGTHITPLNVALFSTQQPGSKIARNIGLKGFHFHGGLLLTLLGIFLGGLALNLTPCIYPLIPITVSFFGARSADLKGRKIIHGAMYICGLALTNSVLGVSAALTGGMLGSALQNPIVLIGVSGIILAMGLSFFGFWEIRLPSRVINAASKGFGGFFGSFFMGLTLGIVAAPCLGPFVLGLLTYVGQKGDPFLGFLYFFVLSIGLGLPLGILAVSSGAVDKLPMSGNWLLWIKKGFGWVLIGMAVFMVRPILPGHALKVLSMAAVLVAAAFHIGFLDKTKVSSKAFNIIKIIAGIGLLTTAFLMSAGLWSQREGIHWIAYRPGVLQEAKKKAKPVMIDFFAEWCTPCREMDKTTFRDTRVVELVSELMPVRVDLTVEKPEATKLVHRFNIRGVPTVVFIRSDGTEARSLRIESHLPPEALIRRIRALLGHDV